MAIDNNTSHESGWRSGSSILFHADASDPDMRYFSRFRSFDPYLAFSVNGSKIGVAPHHEYGRMVAESAFDEVLCLPEVQEGAARRFKLRRGSKPSACQLLRYLKTLYGIRDFRVGSRFPAGLFDEMRRTGLKVTVEGNGGLLPERERKGADEVAALRKANRASAAGFRVVAKTLAESKVRSGVLHHGGRVLTSERLREMIQFACLDAGASALHTIAAAGDQVVDNHCVGHGPIRAGELIVVDIFPQRIEDGYWGDMTRTYLKGRASDAQRRLVRTVKKAHQLAIDMIKPGVTGGKVHDAVLAFFDKEGYETVRNSKTPKGFFHALGHGVGLEIHEEPIMRSKAPCKLRKGMVVTVEPGLYYEGLGGCRIEDTVHLVPGGCELISRAPYKWEIA